jgi:hypothetical protein
VFTEREIRSWFSETSPYGRALAEGFSAEDRSRLESALVRITGRGPVPWLFSVVYLTILPSSLQGKTRPDRKSVV